MTFAVITALAVMIVRLALYYSGNAPEGTSFMLIHFLAIVTLVFFGGLRSLNMNRDVSFPDLVREGLRNASLYALLIAIFLWFFYIRVDTLEFPNKINERVALMMNEGMDEATARDRLEKMFNPFNYASITFFALLAVGAFNALLIALLHHKVIRNIRR